MQYSNLVSIIENIVSYLKDLGRVILLSDTSSKIVAILTFLFILLPAVRKWVSQKSFLLPTVSCEIENWEKISVTINIKKYPDDFFYGEFVLSIKQTGGTSGLISESIYPANWPQIIQITNWYSSKASQRLNFKKIAPIENDLRIRIIGDIGNDVKKTRILIIKKDIINKLLQKQGQVRLRKSYLSCSWATKINYKI